MNFLIRYDVRVLEKDWPKIPKTMQIRMMRAIEERLETEPTKLGKPLKHNFSGCYRLRVGDYRIIYFVKADIHEVIVLAIKHRKDVYDD
jgi:mRNA interferase RelE/StbE